MPRNDLLSLEIKGLDEAERELARMQTRTSSTDPAGLPRFMRLALGQLERYSLGIVHVDESRLKNSIFSEGPNVSNDVLTGFVATAGVEYALAEHERGGSHAFFARTVEEEGPAINDLFRTHVGG